MRATTWIAVAMFVTAVFLARPAEACDDTGDGQAARRVLRRATRLVRLDPGITARLIDPELAPDPEAVKRLDAFVVREAGGNPAVIYLNCLSQIVRQAAGGADAYVIVLAAVLHHEAQHVNGATEADARRAEVEFFRSHVRRGDVSPVVAEAYLELLARRNDLGGQ